MNVFDTLRLWVCKRRRVFDSGGVLICLLVNVFDSCAIRLDSAFRLPIATWGHGNDCELGRQPKRLLFESTMFGVAFLLCFSSVDLRVGLTHVA